MASIKCRTNSAGEKSYLVQVRLKGYPPQNATFKRLTDARKWAASTESAIRERRHFKTAEAKKHTVADLIDRYQRDILPKKKPWAQKDQARQLRWWKVQIGHYALADVDPILLAEHRDKLTGETTQRGELRTGATANRYLAALSHAFRYAVNTWGWLEDSPFRKVDRLEESKGRVRYLSDDERERLLDACKASSNPDLYPAVVLALSTGARRMEALAIRWRDVDLKRGGVILQETKNGERRALPLKGLAYQLISNRNRVRRIDTDFVFPAPRDPSRPAVFRKAWENAIKRAGIDDFRFHDLRHSAASYLAMGGATSAEIAEVLGHKTLQMVKRYSHLSEGHVGKVVERMNTAIFGEEV